MRIKQNNLKLYSFFTVSELPGLS